MSQQDNSVHQALAHLDRVNQFITTLRQLGDNEVAIAAVCRDELAHLTNTFKFISRLKQLAFVHSPRIGIKSYIFALRHSDRKSFRSTECR